jgi:hypothetical protein
VSKTAAKQKEYGDFQTPAALAQNVVSLVAKLFGTPDTVVEPTCGQGAFLLAAIQQWENTANYFGFELNSEHIKDAHAKLAQMDDNVRISQSDCFLEDWKSVFDTLGKGNKRKILVLGNPPWATNSALSKVESQNLPPKTNFQRLRGLDALTGKANFDIAEWLILQLLGALPENAVFAMLCKTSTARKVLRHIWKTRDGLTDSRLYLINAKTSFGVAVDACLFTTTLRPTKERVAALYESLDAPIASRRLGLAGGDLVSDIDAYRRHQHFDGGNINYSWRSGVKHDASAIMELERDARFYRNALGEEVALEDTFVYPLLKSSDIGNGRSTPRKFVLVPQSFTGDDTTKIRDTAPRTWEYLNRHADVFAKRGSSIYKNRFPFSVFGVGSYTFAPWKVAISGLYKTFHFVLIPPLGNRPVLLDDTCYALSCRNEEEARLTHELLTSKPALEFLRSLVFTDSKRPVTADILRRLSISELAHELGRYETLESIIRNADGYERSNPQFLFLMEPKPLTTPTLIWSDTPAI